MRKLLMITALLAGLSASAQTEGARQLSFHPSDLIEGMETGVIVSSLDGNMNGARSVFVRGINTLRSDGQPLWIVDGVILNNSLNQNTDAFFDYPGKSHTTPLNMMAYINAEDIESVQVIKNLSAASIYGSLGANGVVIVTTRKPKTGEVNLEWASNCGVASAAASSSAFRTAFNHNHSLRVNGTSSNSNYYVGAWLRDLKGTTRGVSSTFGGLSAGLETTGNPLVSFGMSSSLSVGSMSLASGGNFFNESSTMISARLNDNVSGWLNDYDDDVLDFRTVNSMWLDVKILPSLKWHSELGVDFEDNNRGIWYGDGTSFGAEVNRAASEILSSMFRYNIVTTLQYKHYFGADHKFEANAGVGTVSTLNNFNTISGTDLFTDELRAKGVSLAGSEHPIHRFHHTTSQYYGTVHLGYGFRNLLTADANLRADTTPRYDDGAPELFGGMQLSFDIKKAFFKNMDVLSALSAEGGWGKAGYCEYIPYRLLGNYTAGDYPKAEEGTEEFYEGVNFLNSREWNAVLAASFLDKRIGFRLTRYLKVTRDKLATYCFGELKGKLWERSERKDLSSWYSEIGNAGWEFSVDAEVFRGKDADVKLFGNVSLMKNSVIELDTNDIYGTVVGNGIWCNMNAAGHPVGTLIGVKVDKNGNFVDTTSDGRITEEDKQIIGNPFPKFTASFGAVMKKGPFDAEILFTSAAGFDLMNLNSLLDASGQYIISEKNLEKGDYLRLRRLSLGWTIPSGTIRFFKELKLSLSAHNLFTLSSYSGWNPSVSVFGLSTLAAGIDYGSFPLDRMVVFGVNAKF